MARSNHASTSRQDMYTLTLNNSIQHFVLFWLSEGEGVRRLGERMLQRNNPTPAQKYYFYTTNGIKISVLQLLQVLHYYYRAQLAK